MRERWLRILACCAGAVALVVPTVGRAEPPEPAPRPYVIVKIAPGLAQAQRRAGPPPTLAEEGFRQVPVPAGRSTADFLAELRRLPLVESAEEDGVVTAADVPNDPYYAANQARYLGQIGAPAGWDIETGNQTIVVAVLDTGADLNHPDFVGRLWENPADSFNDGIDHDGNGCVNDRYGCRFVNYSAARGSACGYPNTGPNPVPNGNVSDDNGTSPTNIGSHGTLVSGIIGAAGNNGAGVTGVAWNVRLMVVKVLDCGSGPGGQPQGDIASVAQGIEYARLMGANIINLSLATQEDKPVLRAAIKAAQDAGIIVVAAAGNYGQLPQPGPGYPAAYAEYPNVIAVGSADNEAGNTWAKYSAYGPALDFAAPGNNIVSTARTGLGLQNPYALSGHDGGTSFSTPLVSGMFALMMMRNSKLGAAEYIHAARSAATPAAPAPHGQNWAGSGIIDIGGAVARVPMTIAGTALKDWRDVPAGTLVSANIEGHECGSTTVVTFGPVSPYSLRIKSAAEEPGCGVPGKTVQLSIGGQAAVPSYMWGAKNVEIGLTGQDISSVSPPPGAIVVQTLNGSWSNIAHFETPGPLPNALSYVPSPWSAVYSYDPLKPFLELLGGYRRFIRSAPFSISDYPYVQTYDAFWVNAPANQVGSVNPNPPPGRVIQLHAGWNNFVYTGTSRAVADALAEVAGKYTEVAQFDNASGGWLLHHPPPTPRYVNDFGGLFKLKVYWIYMTQAGSITMN